MLFPYAILALGLATIALARDRECIQACHEKSIQENTDCALNDNACVCKYYYIVLPPAWDCLEADSCGGNERTAVS
jgi:hypothetical protein